MNRRTFDEHGEHMIRSIMEDDEYRKGITEQVAESRAEGDEAHAADLAGLIAEADRRQLFVQAP